jgi:hypothetical protein
LLGLVKLLFYKLKNKNMKKILSNEDEKDIQYLQQRLIESFGKNIPKHLLEPKTINETDKEYEERYNDFVKRLLNSKQ